MEDQPKEVCYWGTPLKVGIYLCWLYKSTNYKHNKLQTTSFKTATNTQTENQAYVAPIDKPMTEPMCELLREYQTAKYIISS